jgi:hypothetical protein
LDGVCNLPRRACRRRPVSAFLCRLTASDPLPTAREFFGTAGFTFLWLRWDALGGVKRPRAFAVNPTQHAATRRALQEEKNQQDVAEIRL